MKKFESSTPGFESIPYVKFLAVFADFYIKLKANLILCTAASTDQLQYQLILFMHNLIVLQVVLVSNGCHMRLISVFFTVM